MRVYVGQTRSRSLIKRLEALDFGECVNIGEFPPRRTPWFADNGAFVAWRAGAQWPRDKYLDFVRRAAAHDPPPDFLVVPDIVGGGSASLRHSLTWVRALRPLGRPAYLAVQDGMALDDVAEVARRFDGLFVGGTLRWKIKTGEGWVKLAHALGRRCHVGRCGTTNRVRWARRIGADSIDSALPLWSEENLSRFLAGFDDNQPTLWGD